jgi:hypothetical protein
MLLVNKVMGNCCKIQPYNDASFSSPQTLSSTVNFFKTAKVRIVIKMASNEFLQLNNDSVWHYFLANSRDKVPNVDCGATLKRAGGSTKRLGTFGNEAQD